MGKVTTPDVNRPTDVQKKEADVNRKLQVYGIISAFQNGKVPSNDQIDVALNSLLASKALSKPSKRLSPEGQTLIVDVKDVIHQAQHLLLTKNNGNLIQDFIWQTSQFDPKSVSRPSVPLDKETAQRNGDEALEGLRTLGKLIITNGQFRKLLKDFSILLRDVAGDAATNAASRVRPSQEDLAQIDNAADDNTWHDAPDFSKEKLKKQISNVYKGSAKADVKSAMADDTQAATTKADGTVASRGGISAGITSAKNALHQRLDSNIDPKAKEAARSKAKEYRARSKAYLGSKMPQERRDQTIWRLKKMVIECQQHSEYQRAVQTLLDLAENYGGYATTVAKGTSGSLNQGRVGLAAAENGLRTLVERFANGTSTDDLWDSIGHVYRAADKDLELKAWFKQLNQYIRRCLTEHGYVLEEASSQEWRRLYDQGQYLLRHKYRAQTDRVVGEVKFLAEQLDQDVQNKAFAASMTKLFTNLGKDDKGKPTFKPHLIKDLTHVIVPAIFENVAYIPVPRIEYTDDQVDVVIENLVLESDNFMPNVLEVASENLVHWNRVKKNVEPDGKKADSKSFHSFTVKVSGIQMDLRDVSYFVRRKKGFLALTDQGVASLILAGDGFSFGLKMSSADAKDKQNFFKVDKVDVNVKKLNVKLSKSKFKLLFALIKPVMLVAIRPALQKALEKAIKDNVDMLDRELFRIKQDVDHAIDEACDDPNDIPNIYKRYARAIHNRLLAEKEKKKQQEAKEAVKKRMNYAITSEDSILPDIALPGGISSKATEYKELARKGDKWESPVFSIGSAGRSTDLPPAPRVVRKSHAMANGVTTQGNTANPATIFNSF